MLSAALASDRWFDLHAASAHADNRPFSDTCFPGGDRQPSRIDLLLRNRAALSALVYCSTIRTVRPIHHALQAVFRWEVLTEEGYASSPWRLRQIRRLDDLAAQLRHHGIDSLWAATCGPGLWKSRLGAQGFGFKVLAESGFDTDSISMPSLQKVADIRAMAKSWDNEAYARAASQRRLRQRDAIHGV